MIIFITHYHWMCLTTTGLTSDDVQLAGTITRVLEQADISSSQMWQWSELEFKQNT